MWFLCFKLITKKILISGVIYNIFNGFDKQF